MSELLSEKRLNDIHSFLVRHDINGYFSKWLKKYRRTWTRPSELSLMTEEDYKDFVVYATIEIRVRISEEAQERDREGCLSKAALAFDYFQNKIIDKELDDDVDRLKQLVTAVKEQVQKNGNNFNWTLKNEDFIVYSLLTEQELNDIHIFLERNYIPKFAAEWLITQNKLTNVFNFAQLTLNIEEVTNYVKTTIGNDLGRDVVQMLQILHNCVRSIFKELGKKRTNIWTPDKEALLGTFKDQYKVKYAEISAYLEQRTKHQNLQSYQMKTLNPYFVKVSL